MSIEDPSSISEKQKDRNDSLRVHLKILQTRISLHGSRMWQLPLTYLATIAGSVSFISGELAIVSTQDLFISLLLLGLIFLYCFYGASGGYIRAVQNMNEVEGELGIEKYAKHPMSHTLPYWTLLLLGVIVSFLGAVKC